MGSRLRISFLYWVIILLSSSLALAQSVGVTSTVAKKIRSAATLPSTCAVGEIYSDSDATSGQRIYLCESTNTWILQGDGGAPTDATYITQTANTTLTAEQALSTLSTGIMRVATTTGAITSLTDSAGIAANISDETGSGAIVFGTNPTLSVASGSILLPSSISLPATCSTGQIYMDTDATSGQRIYACESANTWVLQGKDSPAGSDTQVQFNDAGSFGGDAGFVYDKTTDDLTLGGYLNLTSGTGNGQIRFSSVVVDANTGILWHGSAASYGIYRTSGGWNAPNYAQLQIIWETGIVIEPGATGDKAYLDIQGDIRLAGTTIYTPSSTQVIDAVGDAILANATVVVIDPNGDYILTSAPTIANGTTGQIAYITAGNAEANIVTVQDQDTLASSNLQLGATTRAISGKDCLILLFDSVDWIEIGYSNN